MEAPKMKRKQRKWRVTRKQRVTECKMEGWRPRGGGRKRDKHGEEGPEQDFCFFCGLGCMLIRRSVLLSSGS